MHQEIGSLIEDLCFSNRLFVAHTLHNLFNSLLFFLGLNRQVLFQLLLQFLNQIGMLDIDMFGFLLENWWGALLEEVDIGRDDILSYEEVTYFWNMISCLISLRNWNPARDFLELKSSFSTKDS